MHSPTACGSQHTQCPSFSRPRTWAMRSALRVQSSVRVASESRTRRNRCLRGCRARELFASTSSRSSWLPRCLLPRAIGSPACVVRNFAAGRVMQLSARKGASDSWCRQGEARRSFLVPRTWSGMSAGRWPEGFTVFSSLSPHAPWRVFVSSKRVAEFVDTSASPGWDVV